METCGFKSHMELRFSPSFHLTLHIYIYSTLYFKTYSLRDWLVASPICLGDAVMSNSFQMSFGIVIVKYMNMNIIILLGFQYHSQ